MDIKIFHGEGEEYMFDDSVIVFHFNEYKDDPSKFMNNIMEKYKETSKPIVIITNIECDDYSGPCGCGRDPCRWHRYRYYDHNDDFAPCLCSVKYDILCDYHRY
jgi:hypothetical protein